MTVTARIDRVPSQAAEAPSGPRSGLRRLRLPIAAALVGGIALLLLVAVGGVLLVTLLGARTNTLTLLGDKANIGLDLLESRIRSRLDPVMDFSINLADLIADGTIDRVDPDAMAEAFKVALAAVPEAMAISFIDTNEISIRANRMPGQAVTVQRQTEATPEVRNALEGARSGDGPTWFSPFWLAQLGQPVLNLRVPVEQDGIFLGAIIAVASLGELADYLAEMERGDRGSAFVLYDQDHVLAHPALRDTSVSIDLSGRIPLPVIESFDEPAFQLLRDQGKSDTLPIDGAAAGNGLQSIYGENGSVVILRSITGYGPQPWTIGLKFRKTEIGEELARLREVAWIGVTILVVAVALGLLLGRALTRQIGGLSAAAAAFTTLDMERVGSVPDSRFRELSDAARAFNAMTAAMRWFEIYVPKSLVLRLMRQGDAGVTGTDERILTVMFTDIRGFSTMAERRPAADIADLLNNHFEMLTGCIEAEGGTVDKFIGDSVMAFWGAPEDMHDHAARALAAARAIQRSVEADNAERRAAGERPVAIRIGIHTGPVVVGNIGSKARLNYTVVGDTVNTAARLERLAKNVGHGDDCVILLSRETAQAAADRTCMDDRGPHVLRGRGEPVRVYRLLPDNQCVVSFNEDMMTSAAVDDGRPNGEIRTL